MPNTSSVPPAARRALAVACLLAAGTALAAPTAYVTVEKAGVGVIDLDQLTLTKTLDVGGKSPRGLAVSKDGKHLYTANKDTGDLSVIDLPSGKVAHRIHIGKNPEFVRVLGDHAYVTYEPGESGPPPKPGSAAAQKHDDDDAHKPPAEIAVVDLRSFKVVSSIKSGHETEGVEFSADGKLMLVTNEGDDTVLVYDRITGKPVKTINTPKGGRPRGIKLSPDGKEFVVTLENANKFLVVDAHTFATLSQHDTKLGPYGVAYGPSGKRLFVAASRDDTIQVFNARDYAHEADIPVGKRCWHFSFTPDASKLLVACGRSDALYVLDAQSYKTVKEIPGMPLAWGIVTSPKSAGTLDSVRAPG